MKIKGNKPFRQLDIYKLRKGKGTFQNAATIWVLIDDFNLNLPWEEQSLNQKHVTSIQYYLFL